MLVMRPSWVVDRLVAQRTCCDLVIYAPCVMDPAFISRNIRSFDEDVQDQIRERVREVAGMSLDELERTCPNQKLCICFFYK